MSDQPKYQTLRDYLRVIRAQRWLILAVALAFGAAALAYSLRQEPEYQAEAALQFKDITQDLRFVGASPELVEIPAQRAAIEAQRVTSRGVIERVRKALGLTASIEAIKESVSARAEAQTFLVVITARAGSAEFAARLANEFARQTRALVVREIEQQLDRAEDSIREGAEQAQRNRDANLVYLETLYLERLSRVQALRDFGRPVEVARVAEVPEHPVSPTVVRNTVLGVVLGLALALLVAFMRDSLDVRLRGAREIQAHVKLPIVGHIGSSAMGGVAQSVAGNGHRTLSSDDLESFSIIRTNLDFLEIDTPIRTLAVTSALPEEGKSTVAAALASTYALGGKSALLVECDLRRPALAARLHLERIPGLSDYLTGRAGPQDVLQSVPLLDPNAAQEGDSASGPELICITAGTPVPRPADILASQRFRDFLREVREAYEVVILDTSPLLPVSDTLELLPQVDGALLCIRAGSTRREEARAAKAALDHLPDRPMGLVVTGIRRGDEAHYGYYSASHSYGSSNEA